MAARRGGERAGADVADVERARGDGGDHVGAAVELAPVDLGPGGGDELFREFDGCQL